MRESLIWHPVSIREASKEEFREQVAQNLPEPGVVRDGKWPEPDMVYLVTLTNGEVDIDEFDLDGDYDWFWYDFERIRAWMEFTLRKADEPNSFWHSVKDALPKRSGPYLVFFTNGTYRVEDFFVESQSFRTFSSDPVAWAELPEPYQEKP